MKIFIAGVCGTFMAGIAQIAQSLGHQVSGCDANVYPPMSNVLAAAQIEVKQGYLAKHLDDDVDCVVIGNALSRGNPLVEHVLNHKLNYDSGPGWLNKHVLNSRKVIAVAGTHGKTSTAAMVSWILHQHELDPGFLIGGKPGNFDVSARLGSGDWFVIEADEYDTAFFDKRSKFVHYAPDIAVLNNLEFDHADIFDDLSQIKRQFHHLIRIVPGNGHIVWNRDDQNLLDVLAMGSWSEQSSFSLDLSGSDWSAQSQAADGNQFSVHRGHQPAGQVTWQCIGEHNIYNGLAAVVTAVLAGVPISSACSALTGFKPTARRLQKLYDDSRVTLYEDFAHHPTAIETTLKAVKAAHPDANLIAIVEPRSNTMQTGSHGDALGHALGFANHCIFYTSSELSWQPRALPGQQHAEVIGDSEQLINSVIGQLGEETVIVAMSNGSFDQIPARLAQKLH